LTACVLGLIFTSSASPFFSLLLVLLALALFKIYLLPSAAPFCFRLPAFFLFLPLQIQGQSSCALTLDPSLDIGKVVLVSGCFLDERFSSRLIACGICGKLFNTRLRLPFHSTVPWEVYFIFPHCSNRLPPHTNRRVGP